MRESSHTEAWRAKSDRPWKGYDVAIVPDKRGRQTRYHLYLGGHQISGHDSLSDAKRVVQAAHPNPLPWRVVHPEDASIPRHDDVHGMTTEFNHPTHMHVVERLPKLGRTAAEVPLPPGGLHGLIMHILDTEPEHIEDGIARYGTWAKEKSGSTCPIVVGSPEFWEQVPIVEVSLAQRINACQFHLLRSHLITTLARSHTPSMDVGPYKMPLMAITGGELWCRDGHHRVTADMLLFQLGLGPEFIQARVYNMDAVAQAAGI